MLFWIPFGESFFQVMEWQGVYKFELFTGVEPPIAVMEQAMESMK